MNAKNKTKDELTSYTRDMVSKTAKTLIIHVGGIDKLSSIIGLSKSVIYAAKVNSRITETTGVKIIEMAGKLSQKEEDKPKPQKQDLSDLSVAHKYCIKADNAKNKGHEFALSFAEYKELILQSHCYYTDVLMSRNNGGAQIDTDMTIDRVDNHLGYIPGNVVACCYAANQLKAFIENPKNPLEINGALKVLNRTKEFMENMDIK